MKANGCIISLARRVLVYGCMFNCLFIYCSLLFVCIKELPVSDCNYFVKGYSHIHAYQWGILYELWDLTISCMVFSASFVLLLYTFNLCINSDILICFSI